MDPRLEIYRESMIQGTENRQASLEIVYRSSIEKIMSMNYVCEVRNLVAA